MTKEQLLDIANKSYFKRSPELRLMYATADGNFFFPEKAHYGRAHAKASGVELLMIENPAFAEKKEDPVESERTVEYFNNLEKPKAPDGYNDNRESVLKEDHEISTTDWWGS